MRPAQRSPAGVHDGSAKHVRVPEAGARRRRGEARHDEVSTGDLRQRREKRGKRASGACRSGGFAAAPSGREQRREEPQQEKGQPARSLHELSPFGSWTWFYPRLRPALVKPSQWRVAPMSFERRNHRDERISAVPTNREAL